MTLPAKQWNHIGTMSQRPSPDKLPVGYAYLASDVAIGFEVDTTFSGTHFWQQIFCMCWNSDTPISSVKNISLVSQTLPAAYGSYVLLPGQSALTPDDPSMASLVLSQNGLNSANFSIAQLSPSLPIDVAVYVDGANGNDANPGTQARPVATVRQGFRLWPESYLRTCNMFVSNTTIESVGNLIVYPPIPVGPDAQPPCIIGNMVDVGLGTLTVQSFTLNVVPTPTSAGDAVVPTTQLPLAFDQYAGNELRMLTGSIAGRAYTLLNNDTGAFYLPHASHDGLPTPGDTFAIRSTTTTITINGRMEIRGGALSMYGLDILQTAGAFVPFVVNGSHVYADSVRFDTLVDILGDGVLAPGLAHDLGTWPDSPAPSPSVVGILAKKQIQVWGGSLGELNPKSPTGVITGVVVMRGAQLFVQKGNVNLYSADLQQINLTGVSFFNIIEHWRLNGSAGAGISASGCPFLSIAQVDISDCAGDGISLDVGSRLSGSAISGGNVAGHPNGGVGIRTSHGSQAAVSDPHAYVLGSIFTCITGTGGDAAVGSNSVDTWTNIAANNAAHTTDWNASSTGVATSQGCRVGT